MDTNFEQKVRERAYHIWMSAGMNDGMAHEHWVIAEQAVANETGEPVKAKTTRTLKAAVADKKPAAKKAAAKAAPKTIAAKTIAAKTTAAKTLTSKTVTSKSSKSNH